MHPSPVVFLMGLALIALISFYPTLPTYFLVDDYNFVGHMMVHGREYVQWENLHDWFILFSAQGLTVPELSIFLRPVVHWLWLVDYIAWGTEPLGYRLTNLLVYVLDSFLVYLLARQILRHQTDGQHARAAQLGAVLAGMLFTLHPVHVVAVALVSNRVDLLSAFFYLLSANFFILFRRRSRQFYGALSLMAFAAAIGTKESTVALPLVLLAYDGLYTFPRQRWKILIAQIPYWLMLGLYVALRFMAFGQFGRNTGGGFLSYGLELFVEFFVLALLQPFIPDIDLRLAILILIFSAGVIFLYRRRKAVWFGLLWILISLIPTISTAYVAPRLAYTPSAGLPILVAAILIQPFARQTKLSRAVGAALAGVLLTAYALGLATQVDDWRAVGTVASAITSETKRLHPALTPDDRLYYVGVPEIVRGLYVYNDNFPSMIRLAYRNPNLRVQLGGRFPLWTENLDRAFFLEYHRRKIAERTDLIRALAERKRCPPNSFAAIVWDFNDAQGWQAWNDLSPFQVHDQTLRTRALGNDPYMGSPMLDIPAMTLGEIEITMRVQADTAMTQGAVFWITQGQQDFVPRQQQTFPVQADGTFRTYRVDLVQDGKFFIGDRITRLRLDPTEMPGEIALKSIRVYTRCAQAESEFCKCGQ